jgi:hypothetical protein
MMISTTLYKKASHVSYIELVCISLFWALVIVTLTRGFRREKLLHQPEIIGSIRFKNQVQNAITLLKKRDSEAFWTVVKYLGCIEQGGRSRLLIETTPPTFIMADETTFYSLTWCAAAIAHDSFHSKLYSDFYRDCGGIVPYSVYSGTRAEQACMEYQMKVMRRIGSTQWELEHADNEKDGHYIYLTGQTW